MVEIRDPMLVVASGTELPPGERVWGTGGWLPPEEREALDWLTLARLAGWAVTVARQGALRVDGDLAAGSRWIVVACDPDGLDEDLVTRLTARLEAEPLLIVARAGGAPGQFARFARAARGSRGVGGRSLGWRGPGGERSWHCRRPLEAGVLDLSEGATVWATLDGAPVIAARSIGRGTVATLGFHPSEVRDRDGAGTALLRHLLIWGAGAPVAWHELEGSLVLRMDDAGGAQNVHLRSWSYTKLTEPAWAAIGADLRRRNGRLSIGYISGWVDDGDPARGTLEVAGQPVERVRGRVHPSPLVTYRDRTGLATVNDYQAEYRGIQALRAQGLADVELHGYTHMYPEPAVWAKAPDRFEAMSWYRELGRAAERIIAGLPPDQRPLALGVDAMRRHFGVLPTTVIFPGDEFTNAPVERALRLGLRLVSSYYLALRDRDRFCWTQHVCAPYLDEEDAAWFDAGLPAVGYFHDQDLAAHGPGWLGACLDRWHAAGARRLLDFRELAGIVGRCLTLEEDGSGARLLCESDAAPELVRPLTVGMRWPGHRLPGRVSARLDGLELSLAVEGLAGGLARVILPAPARRREAARRHS
jgi:hypothetical protein